MAVNSQKNVADFEHIGLCRGQARDNLTNARVQGILREWVYADVYVYVYECVWFIGS